MIGIGVNSCRTVCWLSGIVLGLAGFLLMNGLTEMGLVLSLIVALAIAVVVGMMLQVLFCAGLPMQVSDEPRSADAGDSAAPAGPTAAEEIVEELVHAAEPPETAVTEAVHAVQAEQGKAAPDSPQAVVEETQPETEEPVPEEVQSDAEQAEDVSETLKTLRERSPDNLKLLKGVGPALEKKLNDAGVYHFEQIANWSDDDVAAMDEKLAFPGRIARDSWIEQARTLAAGADTEFSARAKSEEE